MYVIYKDSFVKIVEDQGNYLLLDDSWGNVFSLSKNMCKFMQ